MAGLKLASAIFRMSPTVSSWLNGLEGAGAGPVETDKLKVITGGTLKHELDTHSDIHYYLRKSNAGTWDLMELGKVPGVLPSGAHPADWSQMGTPLAKNMTLEQGVFLLSATCEKVARDQAGMFSRQKFSFDYNGQTAQGEASLVAVQQALRKQSKINRPVRAFGGG